ncbi:VWA domain-containing protein [Paenibacillus spiritus]|uniref:VWA domain-containing protein n=1 Tax=Paenibacillus spiritus TaxID=2496557 RepID=A0A5J5G9L2_9BACL|nr:vWA domain-containing protein [Paenibacillus spiritus]KAA9004718.1 VWA domain-containing protein [Paenibacillus spiritus]
MFRHLTIDNIRTRISAAFLSVLLLLALVCEPSAAHAAAASAKTPAGAASRIDAVLLLDVSNSMKTSDPGGIAAEAMKLFVDMLSVQGDKVGIVAYTDKVQREKALMEVKSASDKQDLKDFIDGLDRGAYTDIAVGVEEAVKVLQNGSDASHEPMIVMLADGNNDFNEATGRTESESDRELADAVAAAKKNGYPIYTIGLNADGKLNKAKLAQLSQDSGGKAFATNTADDLPEILSEIFADHLKLKVVPVQSLTANGDYQDVTVSVPNASVLEANISIISDQPVTAKLTDPKGKDVAIPSSGVLLSKSKTYSLIKLQSPQEGDWKLSVKGVPKDKIDINLIFNYDLTLAVDSPAPGVYKKGDKLDISAHLMSSGSQVKEAGLYAGMKAVLLATDLDTGKTEKLPLDNTQGVFKGTFQVQASHNYELKVRAEESSFYRESPAVKINAGGQAVPAASPAGGAGSGSESGSGHTLRNILIALGALAVLAAAAAAWLFYKKANRGFVGQMVVEVVDGNTGEKTYPQYKKLSGFRGKFTLHQLLQLAPELKETENLVFRPGTGDRIVLKGGPDTAVEKSGRAVDTVRGLELKSGDRIAVQLHTVDKSILLEYLK